MSADLQDIIKKSIATVTNAAAAPEPNPEEDQIITQNLDPLTIRNELAGIVVALRELNRASVISTDLFISLLRQFYEFDTGKLLRAEQLQALCKHKLVTEYDAAIAINVAAFSERRKRTDLRVLDELVNEKIGK